MILFKKVSIIGVGLLGGSLGLAIKKKKLAGRVCGYFRNKNKITRAIRMGTIDEGTDNFEKCVRKSDLVILCSPISDILRKLGRLKKLTTSSCIITDTGSTKNEIVKSAVGLNFIGAHPLAGSEKSGIDAASADLFKQTICILTPGKKESFKKIQKFWNALGAKTISMTAKKHDNVLAFTSHLPHAAAFALIDAIPENLLTYGAGGLRDTTRIALSSPEIWQNIFLSNKKEILHSLAILEKSLNKIKQTVKTNDKKKLLSFLVLAQKKRAKLA